MSQQKTNKKTYQDTKDELYRENTISIFSAVCLIVECEELLDSVQQDEGEQRTAEEQEALSDALSTVTQVPFTAWGTLNISNRSFSITKRFRETAFYNCWLATDSPWWKERKQRFIQAGNWYLWSVSNAQT